LNAIVIERRTRVIWSRIRDRKVSRKVVNEQEKMKEKNEHSSGRKDRERNG